VIDSWWVEPGWAELPILTTLATNALMQKVNAYYH